MTFDEAYGKALELTPPESRPKGNDNYPKLLAFLWTMMAVALAQGDGKIMLDDTVYISVNKRIVSNPLQKSSKTKKDKTASDEKDSKSTKDPDKKPKKDAATSKKNKKKKDDPAPDSSVADGQVTGDGAGNNETGSNN